MRAQWCALFGLLIIFVIVQHIECALVRVLHSSYLVDDFEYDDELSVGDLKSRISDAINLQPKLQAMFDWSISQSSFSRPVVEFDDAIILKDVGLTNDNPGPVILVAKRKHRKTPVEQSNRLSIFHSKIKAKSVPFDANCTIHDLRKKVSNFTGVEGHLLKLVDYRNNTEQDKDGGQLLDRKKLTDYGIDTRHALMAWRMASEHSADTGPGWISLLYNASDILSVHFKEHDKVLDFKDRVQKKTGIPIANQALMDFDWNALQNGDGGEFKDHQTLGQYGITDDKTNKVIIVANKKCD